MLSLPIDTVLEAVNEPNNGNQKKKEEIKSNLERPPLLSLPLTGNGCSSPFSSPNLRILPPNDCIISLQSIILDKNSSRQDFKFTVNRLARLAIEQALALLPNTPKTVQTPPGGVYAGIRFHPSICGVSVVRSGEAMELALRDCCRSIRIGKVVIDDDDDEDHAVPEDRVVMARFPHDIEMRKVLLLYPIMKSGAKIVLALERLREANVAEANIIVVSLFATVASVERLYRKYPEVTIQTTEVMRNPRFVPWNFEQKYFGTD